MTEQITLTDKKVLAGKTALVSGASRGIGRAIAWRLAHLGARVIGTATSADGAAEISKRFQTDGLEGTGMILDWKRLETWEELNANLRQRKETVSILVNNAGITRDNLLMRMSDEEWREVMQVNLEGVFRLCRGCLRDMLKARYGRIICISSVVAYTGNAGQSNYAATKAALSGFCHSLAREVAVRGVTVNLIAPGFIETDMTAALSAEQREALLEKIPLGRWGRADEVAEAAAFLASPAGNYITGETLHINGGMFMG